MKKLDIKKGDVVLVIIPDKPFEVTFSKAIIEITSQLSNVCNIIGYISLNKPYYHLIKSFEDNKIDINKLFFIDAVTKPSKSDIKRLKNCIFINSISSLTKMSIDITNALKSEKFGCLLFDSLSTMLIYHDVNTVTKFVHNLIVTARSFKCTTVFTCLKGDEKSSLIKDIGMFVDNIINI